MTYRYFILDPESGEFYGTNLESMAHDYADSGNHVVIDAQDGKWLKYGGVFEVAQPS